MLTRNCMLCGFIKEDLTSHLCVKCKEDQVEIQKVVEEKKLPYWEAEALRQSARDSRRKIAGMNGRMDPRQQFDRQDLSQLKERGLI